jgi:hypothetical protein
LEVAMTTVAGQAFILYAELFVISFADGSYAKFS